MSGTPSGRDALTERILPKMTLGDGSAASMTGPPPPLPDHLDAAGRATARFEVKGNAISTHTSKFTSSFRTTHSSALLRADEPPKQSPAERALLPSNVPELF